MAGKNGYVIWITGLSGAGKSTLARPVVDLLKAAGMAVVMLDGDELREVLGAGTFNSDDHGLEKRLVLAKQYSLLCRLIASQGLTVVIATISLFREVHVWNRAHLPGYFEVYLKVPVDELRRRDPKGIYRQFDAGELANVAGVDLPIDEPDAADLVVEFEPGRPLSALADEVVQTFSRMNEI